MEDKLRPFNLQYWVKNSDKETEGILKYEAVILADSTIKEMTNNDNHRKFYFFITLEKEMLLVDADCIYSLREIKGGK